MARGTDISALKEKYGVDRIWSFSRVNTYIGCPYSYFLKYVKRLKELRTSIYSVLGSEFHDILEKFYLGKIEYDDMVHMANAIILDVNEKDMKFDRSDAEKNKSMSKKYFECIRHFFLNYKPLSAKILTEKEIVIQVGKNIFIGYIDAVHKESETYIITDYKSSTVYSGEKKILQEGRQLILYALGLNQGGIPLENIRCRWNFLKYASITFFQKNGKPKTMISERNGIVEKLEAQIKIAMKDIGIDEYETADILTRAMRSNDMTLFPTEVQNKFTIEDCYVDVPINQTNIDKLQNEFVETINDIVKKEIEFEESGDDGIWKKVLSDRDTFFCSNLCGYTPKVCPCYKDFLDNRDLFKKPENADLGEDADWMKELGLL